MRAEVMYYLAKEFANKMTIDREECVEERQIFVCDTNDIAGLKDLILDTKIYEQMCENKKPTIQLRMRDYEFEYFIDEKNIKNSIKKYIEQKNLKDKIRSERDRLQKNMVLIFILMAMLVMLI